MNYEKDITIDDTALDVEWLGQPSLMLKYARHAASARMELDKAKEAVDLAKAELDKEIRSAPEDFGIEKITEATVIAAIITHDRYKKINEQLILAKFESDIAQGAVRAFDARKDALENLVKLHGQQYFAGPSMPRDLHWEVEQRQKQTDDAIANRLTTRRTR